MRMLVMLGVIATLLTVGVQAQGLVAGSKEPAQQATTTPAAAPKAAAAGDSAIDQRLYNIESKLSKENQGTAFADISKKLDDILRKLDKLEREIDDLERDIQRK